MSESLARTSAGIKLYVSDSTPGTYDKAGYEALADWEEVGEVTNYGEYGKVYQLITHEPVGERKTFKRKGNYNEGAMSLQMARAETDDGQAVLKTAVSSDDPISFKVLFETGLVSDGADYFQGLVMSYTTNIGTGNQILGCTCQVELDGDVIEVTKADA